MLWKRRLIIIDKTMIKSRRWLRRRRRGALAYWRMTMMTMIMIMGLRRMGEGLSYKRTRKRTMMIMMMTRKGEGART